MRKKVLSIILGMAMLSGVLAGCGSNGGDTVQITQLQNRKHLQKRLIRIPKIQKQNRRKLSIQLQFPMHTVRQ